MITPSGLIHRTAEKSVYVFSTLRTLHSITYSAFAWLQFVNSFTSDPISLKGRSMPWSVYTGKKLPHVAYYDAMACYVCVGRGSEMNGDTAFFPPPHLSIVKNKPCIEKFRLLQLLPVMWCLKYGTISLVTLCRYTIKAMGEREAPHFLLIEGVLLSHGVRRPH